MPSATYALIREAIVRKQQVAAIYQERLRIMCSHAIGYKHGREQALFFQFSGYSNSGGKMTEHHPENWRCLRLDELTDVLVREGPWYTGAYKGGPLTCIDEVDVVQGLQGGAQAK